MKQINFTLGGVHSVCRRGGGKGGGGFYKFFKKKLN